MNVLEISQKSWQSSQAHSCNYDMKFAHHRTHHMLNALVRHRPKNFSNERHLSTPVAGGHLGGPDARPHRREEYEPAAAAEGH